MKKFIVTIRPISPPGQLMRDFQVLANNPLEALSAALNKPQCVEYSNCQNLDINVHETNCPFVIR